MILEFDSRRAGRARRPQHAIRRAARGLKTTPQRPQERVARERTIDANSSAGNTAEERVKRGSRRTIRLSQRGWSWRTGPCFVQSQFAVRPWDAWTAPPGHRTDAVKVASSQSYAQSARAAHV